ncbi:MAG: response regulator transcription factor [Actinomycetia bacterium]|nr:response regulator transcription factor [Actinomycetes bacterium]
MDPLRVVLADDHALFRAGLCALLDYSDDIEVVGEAQNGREAVELAETLHPDVIVMDIAMPVMNGIEATTAISERVPEVRVLILTQHEEPQYVAPLLRARACGFITKRAAGSDLMTAIRAVAAGEIYVHPAMGNLVVYEAGLRSAPGSVDQLTTREREVLARVVRGHTNARIARDLRLSVKTVEWHRTNIMRKLGTHGVADLVRYAIEHGLVDIDETVGA